jgi:hypothetical protein
MFKKHLNMNSSTLQQSPNTKQIDNEEKLIDALNNNSISPSNIQNHIKTKFNLLKANVFLTPKFSKRKNQTPDKINDSSPCSTTRQTVQTPTQTPNLNNTDSKSWFQRWNFKHDSYTINSTNSLNNQDREFTSLIGDRPLNIIKADLVHAFLSVCKNFNYFFKFFKFLKFKQTTDLTHNINNNSPNSFRCEYRATDKFLQRNVKFRVEILLDNQIKQQHEHQQIQQQQYKLVFTLTSGSSRQFQNLCLHICQLISTQYAKRLLFQQQRKVPINVNTSPIVIQTLNQQQQQQYIQQSPRIYPMYPANVIKVDVTPNNLSSASSTSTTSTSSASSSSNLYQ